MIVLRSALFMLYFYALSAAMTILWLPALALPRAVTVKGAEWWVRLSLAGARVICGLRWELRGREHLPAGPALIASKHMSMWETMAAFLVFKDPAIILKRELLFVPLYGWYALKLDMIVVDRSAAASALRKMTAKAKALFAAGRPIVIFPEGTRKLPGEAPDYKPGVAALYRALETPCTPVALNSGVYWQARGFLRRPGTIVMEILPPIPAGLPRDAFMRELETRIESASARLIGRSPSEAAAPAPAPAA